MVPGLDVTSTNRQNLVRHVTRNGVFFSGRFDGKFKEKAIRSVAEEVRKRASFIPVLIVDASNAQGAGYGALTMSFLAQMELMVPFAFDDYGQFTGNPYCSFGEVTYCLEHPGQVQCLPLKLYGTKLWPPVPPDHDGGFRGATQNEFFFKTDLLYKEFPIHNEAELLASKTAMADCIIDRYLDMHPELRGQDCRGQTLVPEAPKTGASLPLVSGGAYAAGQHVQYYSQTQGCWLRARVEKLWGDGNYEISIRPGQHIPAQALREDGAAGDETDGPAAAHQTRHRPAAKTPFHEGDLVDHVSSSGSTTSCKVLSVDVDGCYLDVDPKAKVPFASVRPRKHKASFKAGDAVLYNSQTLGTWIQTKILLVKGDGQYEIEAKPGCAVPQELLKGAQQSGEEAASPQHSSQDPASPKKFAVGQHVMYMVESKERGTWVARPTVILAANDDGTFEVEGEKGARIAAGLLWAKDS